MKFEVVVINYFLIMPYLIGHQIVKCQLNEYFKYYEIAKQNSFRHVIKKRWSDDFHFKRLDVKFKDRLYKLELQRENTLFSPKFKIYSLDERDVATEVKDVKFKLFHGFVTGERDNSKVSAIFGENDELGSLVVRTSHGTFAGEPISSYVKNYTNPYDLIMYAEEDLKKTLKSKQAEKCDIEDDTFIKHDPHLFRASPGKRSASKECQSDKHKACKLYLVADYSFFKHVGRNCFSLTVRMMVSIIDQVNEIFKATTFGECGQNFGFQIENMTVYKNFSEKEYHFNQEFSSPQNSKEFLCRFGKRDVSPALPNYCLGHLFTAKSMQSDVLGLSNIGSMRGKMGGICSKNPSQFNAYLECYTNTGFTTFKDSFSNRLPSLQAMLVVAHEMGHSFGSHHDPDSDPTCVPHGYPGYFLMYTFAVSGTEPNNKVFSNCSIMEIKDVLMKQAPNCFVEYNTSFCGNYKIEGTEECDDGLNGSICCSNDCRLINGAQCSIINHECCAECKYASNATKCRNSTTCHHNSYCTGESFICPKPMSKSGNASCKISQDAPGQCFDGECLNLCQFEKKLSCLCQGEDMCKICCKDKLPENSTCSPHHILQDVPDGTACAYGICIKGACKKIEASPIQRLWPIIEIKNISTLVIFTKNNIVGLVLMTTLMVWIPASCAVAHLDRKNMKRELQEIKWMSSSQRKFLQKGSKITVRNSEGIH